MKSKVIAAIVATITMLGPFQYAFFFNGQQSNIFTVLMFVLTLAGLLGAFVIVSEGEKKTEH
jgi:hypothetical protein